MKFSTGLGFGLGMGAGLGFFLSSILRERKEHVSAEEREMMGMNQNDRDYLEEKLDELRKDKRNS